MLDLFSLLKAPKKRVIAERQLEILKLLLDVEWVAWQEVIRRTSSVYATLGTVKVEKLDGGCGESRAR